MERLSSAASSSLALEQARTAAQDVKELASSCKTQSLRDEGCSIAHKAQEVISQVEEKAGSAGGHFVHEAVECAAKRVHQALSQVQSQLVMASREYKGGFLSKVKATLDTSYKIIFREAQEELVAALRALESSLDVGQQDHNADGSVCSQALTKQDSQAMSDSGAQLHLRWDKGTQVLSVGLVSGAGSPPTLWVGLNRQIEFYPNCQQAHKQSQATEQRKGVTCIMCESDSRPARVWTGHADGTIKLHAEGKWCVASYRTQIGVPVRALAADARHSCWAGDDAGVIYTLLWERNSPNLLLRKVEVPQATAGIWQQAARAGPAAGAAALAAAASSGSLVLAPVLALYSRGSVLLSSGGMDRNYITLWNSHKCEPVERCLTQTYGPAYSFAAVSWQEVLPPPPEVIPGAMPTAEFAGWRLLSGHETGQLLLWHVQGLSTRYGMRAIQLLSVILEPKQLSAIRSISCFEDLRMMVLADSAGTLAVTDAPSATNGAASAAVVPGHIPGAPTHTRWTPQQGVAKIKAHKSGIIAVASAEELLVTASNATVKSWTADQLKLEAQGDGLMFTHSSRALTASSSTLSNAAHATMVANAGAAAAAAPAGAVVQPPLPPQLQHHNSGYSGLSGTDTELSLLPAALRGLPEHQAIALQQAVAPVMQMLTAAVPQWHHPGIAPLQMPHMGPLSMGHGAGFYQGEGGAAVGGEEHGGLTETSSVQPFYAIRAEHLICSAELELNEPIGIGAEGKVYRGKWCNIDIAAKEYLAVDDGEFEGFLHPPADDGEFEQFNTDPESTEAARKRAKNALLKEVGLLAKLTHPNLVRFFGVCLDPPLVVMEYYRNSSVFKMLQEAQAAVQQGRTNKHVNYLSWKRRLDMLYDVASGMMYLHSRCHVHGNLRSSNLFVTENGRVKIGDFGFTKRLKCSEETIKVARLTHPRWLAPELLNAYELSTASDVYSFGIIMYEVLTYKIPFEDVTRALVAIHVLANQMRPQIPSFDKLPPNTSRVCLANYIQLMEACWHQDPKQRPSFHTVARRLKAMQRWYWACNKALELSSSTTVRDASAAVTHGKAKGWLKGSPSPDSSELLPAVQQRMIEQRQQQQQQLAAQAPAPYTDAGRQQEQQGQAAAAAAAAAAGAAAMQAQQQSRPQGLNTPGGEDSVVRDAGPFGHMVGQGLNAAAGEDSVVRDAGPFGHMMGQGLNAAAGEDSVVRDAGPFGHMMGPALGLSHTSATRSTGAGFGHLQGQMPPASPHHAGYLMASEGLMPLGRIGSSPRFASPGQMQQQAGFGGAGPVPPSEPEAHRLSNSSKASSTAPGAFGHPDSMVEGFLGGAAAAAAATAAVAAAAGAAAVPAAGDGGSTVSGNIPFKPLDDSILNKNLRVALGRTMTGDLPDDGDLDVVDMQQRDLEAWQLHNKSSGITRRASCSSAPSAAGSWPGGAPGGWMPGGMLPGGVPYGVLYAARGRMPSSMDSACMPGLGPGSSTSAVGALGMGGYGGAGPYDSAAAMILQYQRQDKPRLSLVPLHDEVAMPVNAQPFQHTPTAGAAAAEGAGKQVAAAAAAAAADGGGGFAAAGAATGAAAAEGAGKRAAAAADSGDDDGFAAAAAAAAAGLSGQQDRAHAASGMPQLHDGLDELHGDMPAPVPELQLSSSTMVRDASAADTHDKVKGWLKGSPDSSELLPAVPQRLIEQHHQQQQQQLAAQASAPHTDAGRQQEQQQQQQQAQDAAAAAARAAAMQAQQQPDVFGAEDSPFCALLESCVSTGSVEPGPFALIMSAAAASQSAAVQGVQAPSLMPAFMDPYAVEDSSLPAAACLEAPATRGKIGTGVELSTALGKLELVFLLGEYADHQVYYGLWAGRKVTAKVYAPRLLRDDPFLEDVGKKGLIKEVQESLDQDVSLLTRLQHPNIVPFLGACDDPPTLLLEFYQHGSISWVVHKAARQLQLQRQGHLQPDTAEHVRFLDWGRRLQLLSEVASALAYMHAQGVVHGDLCSSGIFIGGDGRAKVGEMLMPSSLAAAKNGYDVVLTHLQYTAPELLGTYPDLSPTTASDVYSFGVLMFELLSWVAPYEGRRTAEVEAAVMAGLRPELPSPAQLPPDTQDHPCYPSYLQLMVACWDHDPRVRPTFADIHRALQELREPSQRVTLPATRSAGELPTQAVSSTALVPPAEHTSALLQGGHVTTLDGFGSGEEAKSPFEDPLLFSDTIPYKLAAAPHTDSPKALQERDSHAQQADVQVIHAADLEVIKTIGGGAEGTVYQCRWFGVDVAAKELQQEAGSDGRVDASESLMQTAALLSQLRHPNLARFLGICWSPPMLVSEYYPLGSLYGTMYRLQQKMAECSELSPSTEDMSPLSWQQRLEILQDVATAAAYMHSRSVVHGDIRSLNIFLTDSGQAKLGDFGFARTIDASNRVIGTCQITHPRWAAPELMEHKQMGTASDVYSFGMVMYELMSWEMPFADLSKQEVVRAAIGGRRPVSTKGSQLSQECPGYTTLMEQCWAQQPYQRPTMQEVVDKLAALLEACSTKGAPGQELPPTQSADQAGLQEQQQALLQQLQEQQQNQQQEQQQNQQQEQQVQELHVQQPDTCPAGSSTGSQPSAAPGKQLPPGGVPGTSREPAAACGDDAVEAPHRKVTAAFLSAEPPRRLLLSARDSLHGDERGLFDSKWPSCGISRGVSSGLYSKHIQELLQGFEPFHDDPLDDLQSSEFIRVPSLQLSETSQELHDDSAAGVAADAQGGNQHHHQQQQHQQLAGDLSSMAEQLEPLQEVLPSTFQKLLLLSVLYAARKAASSLEYCGAQRASSSSGHKAGVVRCYGWPADAPRGDVPPTSASGCAASDAVQKCCQASCHQLSQLYDMLQWQQQLSAWHLLWASLQPLWSCSTVHRLLLQQMPAAAAAAFGSSMYTQLLYAAAAAVLALASCLLLLLWAAAAWLPHQQQAAAAAMAVAAGVCGCIWLLGWCSQGIGRRQRCFHTWLSLTEVPGDLLVAPYRDPTSSTLCYSAWACRWPAGSGMQPSQGHLLSQQQQQQQLLEPELLLCSLPDCCYQLRQSPWQQQQQQWLPAAVSSSDVSPLPDQGSVQQQQQGKQALTSGGYLQQAAPELVGLQDHPTLSGFLSEEVRRPQVVRALLLPVYNTLQQQQQQQQQWWRGWYQGSRKQLFVPIKWVCFNPPMVLQAVPPGSTLSAWISEHKLQSQQPLADSLAGGSPTRRGDSADSSSSSSSQQWVPPFPAGEWPAVLGWLQEVMLALQQLHKQGFIHGAVHAGCVHLQHDGGCSLSLAGPWFRDVTLLRAVDPALAAPEQVKGHKSSGSSSSPGVDVYGVGMLMWQLASGWVQQQQQQQGDSLAEILAEVNWCHGMVRSYGAAFPGAPEAVAAGVAGWGSSSSSQDKASSHAGQAGSAPEVATQDRRHGWLPTAADSTGWLPSGYRALMASCCCPVPDLRPSPKDVQKQLAGMVGR